MSALSTPLSDGRVDSTTALLNSSNYFPSRLQIPHASLAHFPSLFRRLSRIFSHAYFHHREAFATAESETSLYARFVALCEKYELVSSNLLIIPQSGYEATVVHDEDDDEDERSKSWDDDDHDEEEEEEDKSEKPEASEGKEGKDEGKEAESEERETAARAEDDSREHADGAMSPREDVLRATHSLGRYQSPVKWATSPVQPATKGKPAPAHTSESLSPPSTRATLEGYDAESAPAPLPKGKRGTLGRGKAPRGANVWAAEDEGKDGEEVPPLPSTIGMARKESVESVVYVGKDDEDEDDEAALPSLSDDESPSKPKPKPSEQPTAKPSTLSEAAKPSSPPKPSEPLPMPTSPSPSSSTRAPDTTSTESASPKSPSSPPRTSLSPKSILAAFPERLDSVSPKTVPPEPESTSLSTSPPAQTESAAPSLTQSTLGTSPTPQSTLSTSPNPTLSTSPNQSTLGTSPQSALGTSPRSELQARPGDNGRDQLAVSPRGGTGGRRGGSRKSRVPRSPGKKGRSEGQRTPSAVAGEGAQ